MRDIVYSSAFTDIEDERESRSTSEPDSLSIVKILAFLALNVLLTQLASRSQTFSTIYALVTFLIAFAWLASDKTPIRVIYATAYITGAELIWRGTYAAIFSESGKYAVVLFLGLALLRYRLFARANKVFIFYFLLLLPSLLVMPYFDREQISFNLSGPLALAVASVFFSTQTIDRERMKRILLAILAPTVGLGTLAALDIITATDLVISGESNYATSGWIGPNQMAAAMALGAMVAIYYALVEQRSRVIRLGMVSMAVWLFVQSMFTFSRGGVYNTSLALLLASFFLLRDRRSRWTLLAVGTASILLGYFLIFPWFDNLSGGALAERFQSTDSTGRYEIAQADWYVFKTHPVLGVGPGQSNAYHALFYRRASAHTEYTRLLAEHGS
ncbi:MAG: O-antigen ligase family protein, partial [Chloroflexota bacterium]